MNCLHLRQLLQELMHKYDRKTGGFSVYSVMRLSETIRKKKAKAKNNLIRVLQGAKSVAIIIKENLPLLRTC